ncbi:MAG: transglutaminase domain-containing protein, partial [Patescibacteria group bacterium]
MEKAKPSPEMLRNSFSETLAQAEKPKPKDAVNRLHSDTLLGENYENAVAALDSVEALLDFRKKISGIPFSNFYEVVETITNVNRLALSPNERREQIQALVAIMQDRMSRFSPRVADLYQAFLSEIADETYKPHFDLTAKKIEELKREGDLDVLFAANISWEMKLNRIKNRLVDYLSGVRALDKREGQEMDDDIRAWREEELKKVQTRPPERKNESKPGVDPMDRLKEGERVPAIWSIYPAWGGYYKEQSFSEWDSARNIWVENKYTYSAVENIPLSKNEDLKNGPIDITMSAGVLPNQWVTMPIPYTHDLHQIKVVGNKYKVKKDQNGDIVILVEGEGSNEVRVEVVLAPNSNKKFTTRESGKIKAPDMPAEFSEETNKKLEEITAKKRGNIARARAIVSYVIARIQYLAPKDRVEAEKYNAIYNTSAKGFAGAVDEVKKADCDVTNTYFAALCAKLNIPVRHVIGHSVKGKAKEGNSSIHSGTGHGWSEVWDEIKKEWIRMDATPAGDPNLEKDDEKNGDASAPGDYGWQEAVKPSDEQLEELRKKLAERKENLSYTKEERHLAEAAGVELQEARKIVKEINEAEQTRLPNGELVTDALAKLFNVIVESRKTTAPVYDGPARKREGGEAIVDIVRHKIGILAGDTD